LYSWGQWKLRWKGKDINVKTQAQIYASMLGVGDLVLGWDGHVGLD
jgi:hypothetical protein